MSRDGKNPFSHTFRMGVGFLPKNALNFVDLIFWSQAHTTSAFSFSPASIVLALECWVNVFWPYEK